MQSHLTGGMPAKLSQGPRTGYDLSRMGAGAARGFNGKKKLEAAPWSGTWPAPGATLDLDFANNRGFVRGLGQGGVMDGITYTRASAGWYVDQTGLLVEATNNVPRFDWASTATVAQKNRLSGTTNWGSNQTATLELDGTVGPFPEDKAVKYTPVIWAANRNTTSLPASPIYSNEICTVSIYAKMNTLRYVALGFVDQGGVGGFYYDIVVDLSNGNITQVDEYIAPVSAAYSVIYVGEGWYKVSVTKLCSPQAYICIGATDVPVPWFSYGQVNHTPDGIRNLYLCRPQFEIGEVATDYQAIAQPTTNTPLLPNTTCNGLLIEEARTNRLLWCRDATQTNWTKTDITAAKDQTGIDGLANAASSLTATADGGTCIQTIALASGSRTGSVYLKRLTGTGVVQVSLDGSTWSTVDLSADEWRRIVLSGTVVNPVVGIRLATSGDAVAMDFGQVEDTGVAGAEIVTSPILTTSASATRSADIGTLGTVPFSVFADPAKGTLYAEVIFYNDISTQAYFLSVGSSSNISIRRGSNGGGKAITAWYNNTTGGSQRSNPVEKGVVVKVAFSYQYGRLIVAVNGQVLPIFFRTFQLFGGFLQLGSATNGALRRAAYFPRAMSEGEVGEITR